MLFPTLVLRNQNSQNVRFASYCNNSTKTNHSCITKKKNKSTVQILKFIDPLIKVQKNSFQSYA